MEQAQVATAEAANDEPPSMDEVNEYRRIRPILQAMIKDWQALRGPNGCPAMRHILDP